MYNKKVVVVTALFPPEPVVSAKLSYDIASSLSENEDVTVLCPKPSRPNGFSFDAIEKEDCANADIVRLDSYVHPASGFIGRLRENLSFGKKAAEFIKANHSNISCIYVNSWPLFSQKSIVKISKKYDIPVVMHIQDIYPESLLSKTNPLVGKIMYALLLPIDKYVLRNSRAIIAVSDKMKSHLSKTRNIPDNKITVIQNWQDEDKFVSYSLSKKDRVKTKFTFMYLGNNGPVAGVDFLIDCFGKSGIRDARLVIAGSGSQTERCKVLASSFEDSDIGFAGVPDGAVPEIQDSADVMLLPVKKGAAMSSIPSKLPAYMFSSKPIIGSLDRESDTARVIFASDCGIVVNPEDEDELIGAMKTIMAMSDGQRKRLGENGFKYAMEYLSKRSNLDKIINVINGCKRSN